MADEDSDQPADTIQCQNRHLGDNISKDLEEVLGSDADFGGDFSFHEKIRNTPNPLLTLKGLGTIGIPLSTREAAVVRASCKQAPFGMGERTVVDHAVRDTWEMDASEVTFENPEWTEFIGGVVQKVCDALGVNYAACKPRCDLHKMLLYEEGSHFLPHVDSEKSDGMFATIVIVLPSLFTGGDVHLSHNKIAQVYDCSEDSKLATHVMAWYTDVKHEIKPVKSGYRLALSYNLVRTTTTLRPPLQTNELLAENITRVLQAWKERCSDPSAPEKIIYRLSHRYSVANLKGDALKSVDGQRFSALLPIAERLGFKIGLAHVDCELNGAWDTDDPYNKPFSWCETDDVQVTNLVDLEGNLLVDRLAFDSEKETVPQDLGDDLKDIEADDEDYTEYTGNEGCDMRRWYHLSGLVIWPSDHDYLVRYSGTRGLLIACKELGANAQESTEPSAHDQKLLDVVWQRFQSQDISRKVYLAASRGLLAATVAWDDLDQWKRTIKQGQLIKLDERIWPAIQKWGFSAVRQGMEDILGSPDSYLGLHTNSTAESLLSFGLWLNDYNPPAESGDTASILEVRAWIEAKLQYVLEHLSPSWHEEHSFAKLIEAVASSGGLAMFTDSVLDRVKNFKERDVLLNFATEVHRSAELPECEEKTRVVAAMIEAAMRRYRFQDAVSSQSYAFRYYGPEAQEPYKCVRKCIELDCGQVIPIVVDMLAGCTADLSAPDTHACAEKLMAPLLQLWTKDEMVAQHAAQSLDNLRMVTLNLLVDAISANPAQSLDEEHLERVLRIAILDGRMDLLVSKVVPRLQAVSVSLPSLRAVLDKTELTGFDVDADELRRVLESIST